MDIEYITENEAIEILGAKFVGESDWGNKLYKINKTLFVIVDNFLHTINDPEGYAEPDYPVRKTQFKEKFSI